MYTSLCTVISNMFFGHGYMLHKAPKQCPAGRVFQYRVGSGRVLDKIPGSGSGSGRVGVFKYTIGYFRVSFFTFGYFRVFPGMSGIFGCFWVFLVIF